MKCKECGVTLKLNAKYCPHCGARVLTANYILLSVLLALLIHLFQYFGVFYQYFVVIDSWNSATRTVLSNVWRLYAVGLVIAVITIVYIPSSGVLIREKKTRQFVIAVMSVSVLETLLVLTCAKFFVQGVAATDMSGGALVSPVEYASYLLRRHAFDTLFANIAIVLGMILHKNGQTIMAVILSALGPL